MIATAVHIFSDEYGQIASHDDTILRLLLVVLTFTIILFALFETAKELKVLRVYTHFFGDGREYIKVATQCLIKGEGEASEVPIATLEERYKKDETDEFLKPIIISGDEGRIIGT